MQIAIIYYQYSPMPITACRAEDVIACIFSHYMETHSMVSRDGKFIGYRANNELNYTIEINEPAEMVRIKNELDERLYKWDIDTLWQEDNNENAAISSHVTQ